VEKIFLRKNLQDGDESVGSFRLVIAVAMGWKKAFAKERLRDARGQPACEADRCAEPWTR